MADSLCRLHDFLLWRFKDAHPLTYTKKQTGEMKSKTSYLMKQGVSRKNCETVDVPRIDNRSDDE